MDLFLLALRILLTFLLYVFLGTILAALWRDLRRPQVPEQVRRPRGQLTILQTEGDGLAEGASYPLQPVTTIGRSPTNTLPITDPYASTLHALLTWREGQWWLEDRSSRNGTWLNDTRIQTATIVEAGDVICVGRTHLRLEMEENRSSEKGEEGNNGS